MRLQADFGAKHYMTHDEQIVSILLSPWISEQQLIVACAMHKTYSSL